MSWLALSVNLNKVALLRNQRDVGYPSVTDAARTVIAAGADGITVHPRPDERHIKVSDVHELAAMLEVEFNIEGNPQAQFMALVKQIGPAQCTLVPDSPEQRTSDHGWDLKRDGERLKPLIGELRLAGIRVSLFMDAQPDAMARAAAIGAQRVELYTAPYAAAFGTSQQDAVLKAFADSAAAAAACGLGVNAGHDLTLANLPPLVDSLPQLLEVSIGHAFIADALWLGFEETTRRYRAALSRT